jgi:periplasmic glucans biosynthesis protein
MIMNRREHLGSLGALLLLVSRFVPAAAPAEAFSWEGLIGRAQARSRAPYQPVKHLKPADAIDYDVLNQISYRADQQLFNRPSSQSAVRFFPLSRAAQSPVNVSVVGNGQATPFKYNPALFDLKTPEAARLMKECDGFSGFRVMNPNGIGDWLAFQGASYFRSAGTQNQYGLSARGLAIDTAVPGEPEEFPSFTDFWLEQGAEDGLIIYAILDSPSVCGAYRFVNQRTEKAVTQDVTLALFARKGITQLCIAPLTSMFWYDESDRAKAIDWRPEIHDSDGLAIYTSTHERIWRPLINPPKVTTNSFLDTAPKGFGLLQRDRSFDHYQDDGVFYQKRPNLWVEPIGDWGKGAVVLYEIPTTRETEDNIDAFWVPAAATQPGSRTDFAYRLNWISTEPQPINVARATNVFTGVGGPAGHDPIAGQRKLVIDFEGGKLETLDPGSSESAASPIVEVTHGRLVEAHFRPIVGSKGKWRMTADIAQSDAPTSDIRVVIKAGDVALSETVLYQFHWG